MTDYNKLWQEIAQLARERDHPVQQPHEKSLKTLRREWRMTQAQAQAIVDELLAQGKMKQRQVRCCNGKIVMVYWPV